MVAFYAAPPALSSDVVSLYFAKDALLDNLPVLVFYGPSTTGNSTQNGSRIQAHIYTLAGFQSFPRLTISPSSPLYAAVYHLPEDQQGDQVCRGLAVSLLSYYSGMPETLKASLKELAARRRPNRVAPAMFDQMHAGEVASRMVKIEDAEEAISSVTSALASQCISWLDLDVVLPPKTIRRVMGSEGSEHTPSFGDDGLPLYHYGEYDSLVNLLGSPTFLPTSKLRRAPSKPTAHSKSRSLVKDQKISLRREMCELVDTEERYLGKLNDLVNSIAVEFRQKLQSESSAISSPNFNIILDRLFPKSLSAMLEINESFYRDIQEVLHRTENEAISDIEGSHDFLSDSTITVGRKRDLTGTAAFARELLRWFPKFTSPYQDFMRASTAFPKILNDCLQDNSTNFSRLANEVGEQRLRSALIEPVQRLPRYSLFIDNMVNLLPSSHPGLTSLLKARDIITDICALDTSSLAENNRTVSCLKKLVTNWPVSFSPRGRLITAVDVHQLAPPFKPAGEAQASMLLLFPEALVLLRKFDENALSARGIIAEVDRPITSSIAAQSSNAGIDKGLIYQATMQLASLQLTESEDSHLIWATCTGNLTPQAAQQSASDTPQTSTRVFSLLGAYERKSARFCEEVAKATMEDRFPEALRESDKWALRTISTPSETLSVLAAVWEADPANDSVGTHGVSRIRVVVEKGKSARIVLSENFELDIVACIIPLEHGGYHIDIECVNGDRSTDDTTSESLTNVLVQRLAGLIRNQGQKLNASRISFHHDVLQNLPLHKQALESRTRSFRPISPVKMISNFLSVGMGSQPSSATKPRGEQTTPQGSTPMLRPLSTRFGMDDSQPEKSPSGSKVTVIETNSEKFCDTFTILEETFAAYIVALRSRSGNVVGKVLRGRAGADELMVNELYNILVEDPSRIQSAAEVSVDILFVAFEKFLKIAWTEHMGPVLTANVIRSMQLKFDSGKHGEFTIHFKQCLEDMTPQNNRAFAAVIKLLSDLLDASGNDGDRGALIASFAEVLVSDGNPHDYITLLDRIVDDYDNLFDATPTFSPNEGKLNGSESNSLKRNRSFNTGSLSSNASSLRKKFGFGTNREGIKSDSESRVAAVWRTLSKNAKNAGDIQQQSSSFSKASLVRSRSTDTDTRMLPPSRPVSRDLPPLPCVSSPDEPHSRPGSSHLNISILDTIGEGTPTKPTMLAKKKRRSSLSDLKPVSGSGIVPYWSPSQTRQTNIPQLAHEPAKNLLRPLSPTKTSLHLQERHNSPQSSASPQKLVLPQRFGSPQRLGSPERFGSPERPGSSERLGSPDRFSSARRKENPPLITRITQPNKAVPMQGSNEAVAATTSPKKQTNSQSGIPAPKTGLSERAWPPNGTPPTKKLPQPSQKLRMQSPQKLRERLSNEQKAIITAETSLQAELAKIGEELSVFKLQRSPTKSSPSKPTTTTSTRTPHPTIDTLSANLATLSTTLTTTLASLTASTTSISQDVETSLLAADKKARKLDELYREANAENEALYERFNDELGRILRGVRTGKGVDEMRAKMVEVQGEVARLKTENTKLKREILGLRSLLRDG